MTAETAKKRNWFQVHLSTTCVLMLVAAGLVWLNVPMVKGAELKHPVDRGTYVHYEIWEMHGRGWPWDFQTSWEQVDTLSSLELVVKGRPPWHLESATYWYRWYLVYNILVALGILTGVGVAVEWVVWIRERKQQESRA